MSDAGSGGRFPFLRRNKNSNTPNAFPQSMDPIAPTTGEIHQVFTPSTPRHAATTSDVTGDFPAMPTSTEGMDEQTERQYAMALAQGMSLPTVYRAMGCRECSNTGYHGRVAIQQVMGVDTQMEDLIARGATSLEIEQAAKSKGMTSLREDGWQKVLQGITSVDEVLRVTV